MKTITTKMYYLCTFNMWKNIKQKDSVRIPDDFYLSMAEDLCGFYDMDFGEFLDSTNGQALQSKTGISDCYKEPWTNTVNDMGDIEFRFKRQISAAEVIYNKVKLWVSRKKKCSVHELDEATEVYKKYIPYTDILRDKVYIIVMYAKTRNGEVIIPPKYSDRKLLLCNEFSKNTITVHKPKKKKR